MNSNNFMGLMDQTIYRIYKIHDMKLTVFKQDGTLATWSLCNGKRLQEYNTYNNYENYTSFSGKNGTNLLNEERLLMYHNDDLTDYGDEE